MSNTAISQSIATDSPPNVIYMDVNPAVSTECIMDKLLDTKRIITKSMSDITQRGQSIDSLYDKTEDLLKSSKEMYIQSLSCCQRKCIDTRGSLRDHGKWLHEGILVSICACICVCAILVYLLILVKGYNKFELM